VASNAKPNIRVKQLTISGKQIKMTLLNLKNSRHQRLSSVDLDLSYEQKIGACPEQSDRALAFLQQLRA
jgi:hypothetical protein